MSQSLKGIHVFLSYNSRDRGVVEPIADDLRVLGLDVFLDCWSLETGYPWTERLEQALRSCDGVLVFLGRQDLGTWQQKEVSFALDRQAHEPSFPVIPVLLPGADPPLSFLTLNTWIDWREELEGNGLKVLTKKLCEALHRRPTEQQKREKAELLDTPPYRGLLPFREEDASFYYGRREFVLSLAEAVKRNSLTALVGPSGSGKSSLVHAGLLPHLRKSEAKSFWQAVPMRPGPHPISSLASALAPLLEPEDPASAAARLADFLLRQKESLDSLSAKALEKAGGEGMLLLVVDQWEELYTLAEDNESERDRFIEEVLAATTSSSISVLILFRGDFYGRLMEHSGFRHLLQGDCLIPIPDMSPGDLRKAVEEPARKVGLSFEDGLVDEILNDLERQPGQLPLLEFVLSRLWNERDKANGRLLRSSYATMGRLRGSLARKADEITREIPKKEEVRRLFLRLVRVEKDAPVPVIRRRAHLDELDQQTFAVAKPFVENRLLVTGWDAKTGAEILEIAHDALIKHWRRLRAWLEENRAFLIWRDLLEHDLATWLEKGQDESFLLTAGPLQDGEFWLQKHASDLSPEAQGYIRLGIEKRRRAQRLGKLLRAAAVVSLFVLVCLVGSVLYLRADQSRARSAALAAEATRLADRKLDLAILLALQASKISPTADARGVTLSLTAGNPALRRFLRRPETLSKESEQEQSAEEVQVATFGPNALIASGGKGTVSLWDAKQGTFRQTLDTGSPGQVVGLAFSTDGTLLAAGSEAAGVIRLWNLQYADQPTGLDPITTDGSSQNLTFSPDGKFLAWSTQTGLHIWDMSHGSLVRIIPQALPTEGFVSGLAFLHSGLLASTTSDGRIALWEPRTGQQRLSISEAKSTILGIAMPPGGDTLVSAGASFQRWDLTTGRPMGPACNLSDGGGGEVTAVAFSRDGRFLASGHLDRKIRLWDVSRGDGCHSFATLVGHSAFIWTLSFGDQGPGERLPLISGGQENNLILWEADPNVPTFSIPLEQSPSESSKILSVSQGGSLVAVGDSSGHLTLFDGQSQKWLDSSQQRNLSSIERMAFRRDGKVLATSSSEGSVFLWDVDQGHLALRDRLIVPGESSKGAWSLAASQDSSWVAAATKDDRLVVWQPGAKNTPAWNARIPREERILSMAFVTERAWFSWLPAFLGRRQKEYLVTGTFDGSLALWDPATGRKIDTLKAAHSQAIRTLAARADGLFASGSQDRNVRLWRIDQGLKSEGILFLGQMVSDLALSPEGDLLAAAVGETSVNEVVLWDLKAGLPLGQGFQVPRKIESVAFDASGEAVYMGGKGAVARWDLRPATWSARACEMVQRGLSRLERERYLKPSERSVVCPAK